MSWRRILIKCSLCEKETALIGEDIDKKYTIEFYTVQGWSFTKYKTMCPACKAAEREKFEQVEMRLEAMHSDPAGP